MKLTTTEKTKLKKLLNDSQEILILSPDKPDLDSVSSNLVLAKTLVGLGKKIRMLSHRPLKFSYAWMDWSDRYLTKDDVAGVRKDKPDLVIITDAASTKMFDQILAGDEWLLEDLPILFIDHHSTAPDFKTTLSIIDSKSAATGELLYYLYSEMGWDITPELANFMLAGIIFDTGHFQNLNSSPEVLKVSAKLIERGGSLYDANQAILAAAAADETRFKTLAKLQQSAVFDLPFVYAMVNYDDVKDLPASASLIKPLIDSLRFLRDVKAAFVVFQREDKKIVLSMRSQPEIDVAKICESFGGGGHKVAAGALLENTTLAEAASQVLKQLTSQYEALQHA